MNYYQPNAMTITTTPRAHEANRGDKTTPTTSPPNTRTNGVKKTAMAPMKKSITGVTYLDLPTVLGDTYTVHFASPATASYVTEVLMNNGREERVEMVKEETFETPSVRSFEYKVTFRTEDIIRMSNQGWFNEVLHMIGTTSNTPPPPNTVSTVNLVPTFTLLTVAKKLDDDADCFDVSDDVWNMYAGTDSVYSRAMNKSKHAMDAYGIACACVAVANTGDADA
jgi:hypothetical protein